jgi:hypothetical protein
MSSSSMSSIVERDLVLLYSILDRLDGNLHKWPVWSPVGAQSLDPAITVALGSIMRPAFSSSPLLPVSMGLIHSSQNCDLRVSLS